MSTPFCGKSKKISTSVEKSILTEAVKLLGIGNSGLQLAAQADWVITVHVTQISQLFLNLNVLIFFLFRHLFLY